MGNQAAATLGTLYELACCFCAGASSNFVTVSQGYTGVVTEWGKLTGRSVPPGRHKFNLMSEKVDSITVQQCMLDVTKQNIMTSDNLNLVVDAVCYYQIHNPTQALFATEDYHRCLQHMVQCVLRTVLGEHTLAECLSERQKLSARSQQLLMEKVTSWGITVHRVEMKQLDMDPMMHECCECDHAGGRKK